jgi:hypothetical protein
VNRYRLFSVLMLVALIGGLGLAACDDEDDLERLPLPTVMITFEPQPEVIVVPGCTTDELEDWYELASTLLNMVVDEAMDATDREPGEVAPFVARLIQLRDAIARQPVPECVSQIHSDSLIIARGVLMAFQNYGNGDIDQTTLRQRVEDAERQVKTEMADQYNVIEADLQERFEQRAQQEQQASEQDQP